MIIFIKNLYGLNDGKKAYFSKRGIGAFDFVNSKKFASDLTAEEAKIIMGHAEWYKNQYKASEMGIEEITNK